MAFLILLQTVNEKAVFDLHFCFLAFPFCNLSSVVIACTQVSQIYRIQLVNNYFPAGIRIGSLSTYSWPSLLSPFHILSLAIAHQSYQLNHFPRNTFPSMLLLDNSFRHSSFCLSVIKLFFLLPTILVSCCYYHYHYYFYYYYYYYYNYYYYYYQIPARIEWTFCLDKAR